MSVMEDDVSPGQMGPSGPANRPGFVEPER